MHFDMKVLHLDSNNKVSSEGSINNKIVLVLVMAFPWTNDKPEP